jgi:hypothetical protein
MSESEFTIYYADTLNRVSREIKRNNTPEGQNKQTIIDLLKALNQTTSHLIELLEFDNKILA